MWSSCLGSIGSPSLPSSGCKGLGRVRLDQEEPVTQLTGIDGIEQVRSLLLLLDVGVDQQRIGLGVDILHHDLEAVKAACLRNLHFAREALDEVLIDDAVRGSEEGKDVRDEVALVVVQSRIPVMEILGQVDLLGRPEGCLGLLVHLPDLWTG